MISMEAGLQFSINSTNDEQRRELFDNKSHSLATISEMASRLPMPKGRKYTLNFPVTAQTILDAKELSRLFDKEKFIVKITPIHETASAVENGFEVTGYSDYNVNSNSLYLKKVGMLSYLFHLRRKILTELLVGTH